MRGGRGGTRLRRSWAASEDDARHQIAERVVPGVAADLGQAKATPYVRQSAGQPERGVGFIRERDVHFLGQPCRREPTPLRRPEGVKICPDSRPVGTV